MKVVYSFPNAKLPFFLLIANFSFEMSSLLMVLSFPRLGIPPKVGTLNLLYSKGPLFKDDYLS